jgi:sugar-phosphatase
MLRPGDFDAILCDLDGVLVDSEAAIGRGYDEWADAHGLDRDRVRALYPGTPARQVVEEADPSLDPVAEAARIDAIHVAHGNEVDALPGAVELLAEPPAPLAVVTSCTRALAAKRFSATGLTPPEVVVTADDVERGKPDPAAYLEAARRMGVAPERCLVIEDAPAGVRAGKAAGMTVLALTTTHRAEELEGADHLAADLSEAGL